MSETPGNWSLLRDFPGVSLRLPENSTHFTPNSVDFRRISAKTRTIPAPALAPRRNCVLPVAEGAPVRAPAAAGCAELNKIKLFCIIVFAGICAQRGANSRMPRILHRILSLFSSSYGENPNPSTRPRVSPELRAAHRGGDRRPRIRCGGAPSCTKSRDYPTNGSILRHDFSVRKLYNICRKEEQPWNLSKT